MTKNHTLILCTIFILGSCKDEPTGPEMNCQIKNLYVGEYHFLNASKAFDVRTNPPSEIQELQYKLAGQWALHHDDTPVPFPYSEYFIDTIEILDQTSVRVHIFETENAKVYSYTSDDCSMDLTSPDGDLHLEFTHGGDEVTEHRFAIFDHHSKWITYNAEQIRIDTFSFIEFRLGAFSTYEEIIRQFALDHPGMFDTVAIELIQNKTRE